MNRLTQERSNKEKLEHARNLIAAARQAVSRQALAEGMLFYKEAFLLQASALGHDHREAGETAEEFGKAILESGQFAEVEAFFQQAVDASRETPSEPSFAHLGFLTELVGNYFNSHDRLKEARNYYALALDVYRLAPGVEDRQVLFLLQKMVGLNYNLGDLQEARALVERVLALDEKIFGSDHPKYAADLGSLGSIYREMGMLAEARSSYERAAAIGENSLNWDNPRLAGDHASLAEIYKELGENELALSSLARVLEISEKTFGPEHPKVANDLAELAEAQQRLNDLAGARESLARALEINRAAYGASTPRAAADLSRLAAVDREMGRLADAQEGYAQAVRVGEEVFGENHPRVAADLAYLGEVQQALGDLTAARASLSRALKIFEGFLPPEDAQIRAVRERIESLGLSE